MKRASLQAWRAQGVEVRASVFEEAHGLAVEGAIARARVRGRENS
jgi:hypothetical protein